MAIDITTDQFLSGKQFISFGEVGAAAGEQQLQSKDNTTTRQRFHLYHVALNCVTGNVNIFDGSGSAVPILGLRTVGDVTIGVNAQVWDFRDDPLVLNNDDGTSLCISAAGTFRGTVKYGWGV